jgi:Ca2+-transporting ATPase
MLATRRRVRSDLTGGGPEAAKIRWHTLAIGAAYAAADSGPEGLTSEEAARRLRAYGPDVLERTSTDGPFQILWRQANNPLIWVLLAASVLAIALGKMTDGLVVLAVVVGAVILPVVSLEKRLRRARRPGRD